MFDIHNNRLKFVKHAEMDLSILLSFTVRIQKPVFTMITTSLNVLYWIYGI